MQYPHTLETAMFVRLNRAILTQLGLITPKWQSLRWLKTPNSCKHKSRNRRFLLGRRSN